MQNRNLHITEKQISISIFKWAEKLPYFIQSKLDGYPEQPTLRYKKDGLTIPHIQIMITVDFLSIRVNLKPD